MNTKKKTTGFSMKQFSNTAVVLVGAAFVAVGMNEFFSFAKGISFSSITGQKAEVISSAPSPFDGIVLQARAAFVVDLTTNNVLFAKNENDKLPLASVTKLMTALVAREQISNNAVITLTSEDLSPEGDVGLRPGERWRAEDILDVMLIISSNDAAHAIARFVGANGQQDVDFAAANARFVSLMNEKAQILALTSMSFSNESGLDVDANIAGGYGSAHDVATLMNTLWKTSPVTLELTARKDARIVSQNGIEHILPNTDEAAGHFPGLIASKTGYTDLAGGNLAIIFDTGIGHPVAAVVLGSTRDGRFEDMQGLTQATLKAVE